MADATMFPASLKVFQWSTDDNPNPRLSQPITSTDTTLYFTAPPYDANGTTIIRGNTIIGIKRSDGYVESVWCPNNSIAADGLSATGVVRGVRLAGIDYTTAGTALAVDHDQDSSVFCNVSPVEFNMAFNALNGTIASGGNNWKIGDGTDSDITVYAYNADANKPFWRYDAATNQWIFSNDGSSSTPFGTGAGVTGGDGITVTAGDIDIDLTDTTVFRDARTGNEARAVKTKAANGMIDGTFGGVPAGTILCFGAAAAPDGYLLCDGSAVSRTTYAGLFAVLSTTYGVGDGASTFNLPDLRGKAAFGKAAAGTFNALANTGGSETSALAAHTHDFDDNGCAACYPICSGSPNATYTLYANRNTTLTFTSDYTTATHAGAASSGSISTTVGSKLVGKTGAISAGASSITVTNPYLVVNYIIKY